MRDLSIIVPVYNGGKFINSCIENLEKIKSIDFEIIIVNDGSTDSTEKKIKSNIKKYSNIVYVSNTKNHGVSYSRNVGINKSKGKYVTFIDVDDTICDIAYSNMISIADKELADVVVCNYIEIDEATGLKTNSKYRYASSKLGKEEAIKMYLIDKISPSSCDKIYKSELLKKLDFHSDLQIGEDLLFCLNVFMHSKKNCFINDNYYTYYRQSQSAMHCMSEPLMQFKVVPSFIKNKDVKFLEKNYPNEFDYFKLQMITRGIHTISDTCNKKNKKTAIKLLREYYTRSDLNKIIKCRYFKKSIRLEMLILKLFGVRFHLFMTPIYKRIKSKVR